MNRYLLLILLSSWAHVVPLSWQCETGFAHSDRVLSVSRSLMANADLAHLKTYTAVDVNQCLNECCTEKYGSCTVVSFKKNTTDDNCQHFNCRPVQKCIFVSSSLTDSFSFTSSSSPQILVPSSHASKNDTLSTTTTKVTTDKPKLHMIAQNEQQEVTKEAVATYSEEQFAFKNDNTSVKPRKGVTENITDYLFFENTTRSGVKPRKGVVLDGVTFSNNTKSKVKPRKGVGPYQSKRISSSTVHPSVYRTTSDQNNDHSLSPATKMYKDMLADDVISALEKVFEDDTNVKDIKPYISSSTINHVSNIDSTSVKSIESSTVNHLSAMPSSLTSQHSMSTITTTSLSVLQSSLSTSQVASSSVKTPNLQTAFIEATEIVNHTPLPSSSPTIFEHSKLLFHEVSASEARKSEESDGSEESESERKYKSSMHLVLSLVFGLLVLFSVLGVVAKRVYDGWMRRHYRRMDFLIDGMYNGFG